MMDSGWAHNVRDAIAVHWANDQAVPRWVDRLGIKAFVSGPVRLTWSPETRYCLRHELVGHEQHFRSATGAVTEWLRWARWRNDYLRSVGRESETCSR